MNSPYSIFALIADFACGTQNGPFFRSAVHWGTISSIVLLVFHYGKFAYDIRRMGRHGGVLCRRVIQDGVTGCMLYPLIIWLWLSITRIVMFLG